MTELKRLKLEYYWIVSSASDRTFSADVSGQSANCLHDLLEYVEYNVNKIQLGQIHNIFK